MCKLRTATFPSFYNILRPNFAILLILRRSLTDFALLAKNKTKSIVEMVYSVFWVLMASRFEF